MAYQKNINNDNRRSYKEIKNSNELYGACKIISFKFKDNSFARPVIIWGKMANEHFLDMWRQTGWKEGDDW